MKKMKGQGWQIEEMIGVILVLIVFLLSLSLLIAMWGGLGGVLQIFCEKNPTWCGELPACVCCETPIHKKMGWPFDDIYSSEYMWTTEEECVALIKENGGAMHWKEDDPEQAKCGNIPNSTVVSGRILHNICAIPARYVTDVPNYCVCCHYEPQAGLTIWEWDMEWRCHERINSELSDSSMCGSLWTMPKETQKKTLQKLGRWFGAGGEYCEIPYPYNMTTAP
jgi:hypothetical protein